MQGRKKCAVPPKIEEISLPLKKITDYPVTVT